MRGFFPGFFISVFFALIKARIGAAESRAPQWPVVAQLKFLR
jgi:hypothetical protein